MNSLDTHYVTFFFQQLFFLSNLPLINILKVTSAIFHALVTTEASIEIAICTGFVLLMVVMDLNWDMRIIKL